MQQVLVEGFETVDGPFFQLQDLKPGASGLPDQKVFLEKAVQPFAGAAERASVFQGEETAQKPAEHSIWQVQQ